MHSSGDIIDRLNDHNPKALKEFFTGFYPSLCVFTKKFISETDVIEDIAQEAFLVYWESHKQFDNINLLKGFLYSTARNKCLNHLRLKSLRAEKLKNGFEKDDFLYELILEEETYRIIYQFIEKLPPQTRQVIELSMKGYKNSEIADEMEISVNTVKTLKQKAYKVLRENLKDYAFAVFLLNQILNL